MLPLFVGPGTYEESPPPPPADPESALPPPPPSRRFISSFRFPNLAEYPDAKHACDKSTGKTIKETIAAMLKLQVRTADRNP